MALTGKVAIVTGGTGGLGGAVVTTLLAAGATVVVPHHHVDDLVKLRQRQPIASDAPLRGEVVDLTDEAAIQSYYSQVAAQFGGIDILVNLAGGFAGGQPVHETPWSLWQQQLDINLKTTVISAHAAVPHIIARGAGQ